MRSRIPEFDRQADSFDERAGLDSAASERIARWIAEMGQVGAGDLVLEIGAGTGELGWQVARLPLRYLGLDLSLPLLTVFRGKLPSASLAVADCEQPWPLRDGSVKVILASRVAHRLNAELVAQEALRVGQPGALLLIGQIQRDPASLMEELRAQRRRIVSGAAREGQEREGEGEGRRRNAHHLIEACLARGATPLQPRTVARWTRTRSPAQIIAGWEGVSGQPSERESPAGARGRPGHRRRREFVELDGDERADALRELRIWAQATYGDLDRTQSDAEWYEIRGVELPGAALGRGA